MSNEGRTDLNKLVGIPAKLDGEDVGAYKLRVVEEGANLIKEALLYDMAQGYTDWKDVEMTLDEFCIGWMNIYVDNVLEAMTFDGIPLRIDIEL